jgi:hypothetical protein
MLTGTLIAIILILVATLFGFVLWVARLFRQVYVVNAVSHVGCVQQVGAAVSKAHDAMLLRNLADEYDAVENESVLVRLRREVRDSPDYTIGHKTIPALWLRRKADEMDPRSDEVKEHSLSGHRIV